MAYFFCSLLYKNLEPLVKDFKNRILTLQLSQKIVPSPTVGMDSGGGKKVQDVPPHPCSCSLCSVQGPGANECIQI
jgi:hypothetical protein